VTLAGPETATEDRASRSAPSFEDLLAEMSSTLLRATTDQIDGEINRWLRRIAFAFGIDRGSIGQINHVDGLLYTTHQWSRQSVTPMPHSMNANEIVPWLTGKIMSDELVVLSRLEDAPPEAAKDVQFGRTMGTRSVVTVPFKVGGVVVGAVAFDAVLRRRTWSQRTIRRLSLFAEIFGSALQRSRTAAEIRRLQSEVRQISQIVMMGEVTASLAHELNQPLGAILSNAQAARRLLNAKTPDLKEVGTALDDIISDNTRAVETIRNVRALFQRVELTTSSLDLNQILLSVERILRSDAKTREVSLRFELPASLPAVVGRGTELIQALINLVVNAFDSISEAGAGPREVVVRASQNGPTRVHIAVRDSGKGIDPSIMPRLFQAFVTTKSKGMGMGLAIARSIIENHGGRLWATQNPERGATMEFYLPADGNAANPG